VSAFASGVAWAVFSNHVHSVSLGVSMKSVGVRRFARVWCAA
jgi:hypothetical protein